MSVSTTEDADPMSALNKGYYLTAFLVSIAIYFACKYLLIAPDAPDAWWHYFICAMIGVATSVAFVFITQYYTEYRYRPVLSIAEASQTGPATNIIMGLSVGMESTVLPVFTIAIALVSSFMVGRASGIMIDGAPAGGIVLPIECEFVPGIRLVGPRRPRVPIRAAKCRRSHGPEAPLLPLSSRARSMPHHMLRRRSLRSIEDPRRCRDRRAFRRQRTGFHRLQSPFRRGGRLLLVLHKRRAQPRPQLAMRPGRSVANRRAGARR